MSIIIDNYNYGRFLAAAIESALGQTHDRVEVVVVDDGSTDNSREIIRGYGRRILPVLKANGGQASALNAGFQRSHGDVIIFLDADDVLLPDAAQRAVAVFQSHPDVAKVQQRMEVIDGSGTRTGTIKPPAQQPLRSGDLRRYVLTFPFDMTWMATSGNAFARRILRQVFPIPEADFPILADFYLAHITPLFGRVIFLADFGALYRIHGSNLHEPAGGLLDLPHLRQTLTYARRTNRYIVEFADRLGLPGRPQSADDLLSVSLLAIRLVSLKLAPAEHPISGDRVWRVARLGAIAGLRRFDLSARMRLAFVLWFVAMVPAPPALARRLAALFFSAEADAPRSWLLRLLRHRGTGSPPHAPLNMQGPVRNTSQEAGPVAASGWQLMAVVVVNHNTRQQLGTCLASVQVEAPSEWVVVDTASTDGSAALVAAEYPQARLRVSPTNRGYGAAANQGLATCAAPYVLLLNSDTRLAPGALRALSGYLDRHPRAALAGPRLVHPDGTLQASCFAFPTPLHVLLLEGRLSPLVRYLPGLRDRYPRTWSHTRARRVPWVSGAALAIRRAAFESVGGFDESYFMYFEEVDFCYRLSEIGWEVHFAPVTTVVHEGGASTRQQREAMTLEFFRALREFYRQHYGLPRRLALEVIIRGVVLGRLLSDNVRLRLASGAPARQQSRANAALWGHVLRGLSQDKPRRAVVPPAADDQP